MNMLVNCQWSSWSLGACSDTCGGGSLTKTRTKDVEEANGGTCDGQPTGNEICNTNPCPSKSLFS